MISVLLIIAVWLWGVSFVATKLCLDYLTPSEIIAARFILALPFLYIISMQRKLSYSFVRGKWGLLALCGIIIAAHLLVQVEGMKTTTATNTVWLLATIPIFIAVFSIIFLKEKLHFIQIGGIAIAAFGVILLISQGELSSFDYLKSYGDWLILISCITWAIYTILARKLSSAAPLAVNNVVLTIAAIIIVPKVLFTSGLTPFMSLPPRIILALVFLGVFCLGLAFWFWAEALSRKPAAKVGAYIYLEPLSTMAVAPFVLNEQITPFHIFGGILVIWGVWLVEKKVIR
ncbi:MAG: DMT family transporter [Candidatus Zixiibacteriota bacterium]